MHLILFQTNVLEKCKVVYCLLWLQRILGIQLVISFLQFEYILLDNIMQKEKGFANFLKRRKFFFPVTFTNLSSEA